MVVIYLKLLMNIGVSVYVQKLLNKPRSKADHKVIEWSFCEKVIDDERVVNYNFCGKVTRGEVTRLKKHLPHKRGDVASCTNVSAQVERNMASLLKDYKDKKKDKIIWIVELEDDDDGDIQKEIVRQQSQMQQPDRNLIRRRKSIIPPSDDGDGGGNDLHEPYHSEGYPLSSRELKYDKGIHQTN